MTRDVEGIISTEIFVFVEKLKNTFILRLFGNDKNFDRFLKINFFLRRKRAHISKCRAEMSLIFFVGTVTDENG